MAKGSGSCQATGVECWYCCLLVAEADWLLFRLSHVGFCDLLLGSSSCCWRNSCPGLDIGVKNCSVGWSSTNLVNVITTRTVGTTGIASCQSQI